MNWYKISKKSIVIPEEVKDLIRKSIPKVFLALIKNKVRNDNAPKLVDVIEIVNPYTKLPQKINIILMDLPNNNAKAATPLGNGKDNDSPLILLNGLMLDVDEWQKDHINYGNDIYESIIHEMTHIIDPKTGIKSYLDSYPYSIIKLEEDSQEKENVQEKYYLHPIEFDAYINEISETIYSIYFQQRDIDLEQKQSGLDELMNYLRVGDLVSFARDSGSPGATHLVSYLDKHPKTKRLFIQRMSTKIQEIRNKLDNSIAV